MDDAAFAPQPDGIAVIGMAGRFPGAPTLDEFWQHLVAGRELIRRFSEDDLAAAGVDRSLVREPRYVPAHGSLDDIDLFDAAFFGFSPIDAQVLDPQVRLFLECAWEGLERAGCVPATYPGLIGVFAGCTTSAYLFNLYGSAWPLDHMQVALSTDKDHLATQVAYRLNLQGPSLSVQTACSTSLVATALACQQLVTYQCDVALAGGVSVAVPQVRGYLYQDGGILSPDGHCRAFDARAAGTVGGSGAGVVVLKRLADARAEGDPILAVIRGWALNNDGALKVGYTAPSVDGQARVIALAQAMAGVSADTIQYVEAHGTGTPLGDPVELSALTQAFRASTERSGYCALGSVKTNIGHLDAAAGIAGLIKTVLAFGARTIPPSLHFDRPNPAIDFTATPFVVPTTAMEWHAEAGPRRAGVSAFGIGGTNAHIVIEEAPAPEPSGPAPRWKLLLASARTDRALEQVGRQLADHISSHPEQPLADLAYTSQIGRVPFARRRALVCSTPTEAVTALRAFEARDRSIVADTGTPPPVVFLFPGQGAQHVEMLRHLYDEEAGFREEIDRCSDTLAPLLGLDLRALLYPPIGHRDRGADQLSRTALAQPALFVIEYALARLWMEWGVVPHAFLGHSIGEYVAACLAGVLTLEDSLWVVAQRGLLMQEAPPGAMLSVPLGERDLERFLDDALSIASINAPALSVVSGPQDRIARLAGELATIGVESRTLRTSHAFHSPLMDGVLEPFLDTMRMVRLHPPQLPWISNLTGDWITSAEATDPEYWVAHLRQPVRFSQGVQRLLDEGQPILLEVGPGTTLTALTRLHASAGQAPTAIASARHPDDPQDDHKALLTAAGRLWMAGVSPDWAAVHGREQRRRLSLPTYPFERARYWIEPEAAPAAAQADEALSRRPLEEWFHVPQWIPAVPGALMGEPAIDPDRKHWLLFADAHGVATALHARLASHGHHATIVTPAHTFERRGDGYAIRPDANDDYEALVADLQRTTRLPDFIVHLWTLTATTEEGDDLERMKDRGFYSLVCLARALGHVAVSSRRSLAVVTNNLAHLPDDETVVCPAKALMLGPVRVIPQEYPDVECRAIDLEWTASADALAAQVMDDLLVEPFDAMIAYRRGRRWIATCQPARLPTPGPERAARLRDRGVYLISGGMGGIGLTLARYLAETVHAKLVLIGRTGPPPKDRWAQVLATGGDDDPSVARVRALLALEAAGAEVLALSADVIDPVQLRAVVRQTVDRFGALHGVIHTAGVPGGGIIELKTREIAEGVFAPKVAGTLALHAAVADRPLDFFMICSSLSALVGGAGQVDYCAANNFLDAFATRQAQRPQAHQARNHVVTAINWDAWRDVGMAVNTVIPDDMRDWRDLTLAHAIQPSEATEVFDRILRARLPQIAVCTTDLAAMMRDGDRTPAILSAESTPDEPHAPSVYARPEIDAAFVPPVTDTEKAVAEIWQASLNVAPIGGDDSFFALGGHSLLAIHVVSLLKTRLAANISMRELFEHPTVRRLAAWIDSASAQPGEASPDFLRLLTEVEQLTDSDAQEGADAAATDQVASRQGS